MIKIFLRYAFLLFAGLLFLSLSAPDATAQSRKRLPLYIVNGERMSEEQVKGIHPKDIEDNHLLPADEQTIERYGHEAANGVVVITLRYDTPARFEIDGQTTNYSNYIADCVKWDDTDPVARIIISFKVKPDGTISDNDVLEATDKRLLRRIEKAMAEAPRWRPALKDGKGVETTHLLKVTLPKGRTMPRERVVRIQ
ncbi:MAG: TonB-dependent receptor [Alistipes sp.]|nr:TonB-dependent receptor [Alistipes sp.]MBP3564500.1 TonB-dependent receptor [Alistipes sp.]